MLLNQLGNSTYKLRNLAVAFQQLGRGTILQELQLGMPPVKVSCSLQLARACALTARASSRYPIPVPDDAPGLL